MTIVLPVVIVATMHIPGDFTSSPHLLILSIGVLQGLVLSTCLITFGRRSNRSNWLLGLTILTYSLMQIDDILFESHLLLQYPQFSDLFSLFVFAPAPLLYLYIRSLTRSGSRLRRKDLLHFLPLCLFVILTIPTFFEDSAVRLREVEDLYNEGDFYFNPFVTLPLAQVLVYLSAISRLLMQHGRRIRAEYSTLERVSLRWINYLFLGFAVFWAGWLISYLAHWQTGIQALDLAYTAFVYIFGYFGWQQSEIRQSGIVAFPQLAKTGAYVPELTDDEKPRYVKSGMSTEQKSHLSAKLRELMDSDKPFLDPSLSLAGLAEALGNSPHNVSQVINEDLQLSFYEYISKYRVEEAKRLMRLTESRDEKILTIALDSGFNSKSAFNAAFRRHAGVTPSAYRKSLIPTSSGADTVVAD